MTHRVAAAALLLLLASSSGAQPRAQNSAPQQPAPQAGSAQAAPATPPVPVATKKEDDAYKAILAAQAGPPMHLISLGEAFLTNFPMSVYAGDVDTLLTGAYLKTNQTDKMLSAGSRALAANPDNVDVLSALAWVIPREASASTPEGQQQLQQAAGYARHAIALLGTLAKPATVDDATFARQKNDDLSKCHSGLGLIDVKTGNYADAAAELTQAVQLAAVPGMVDYYMLGIADEQTGRFHESLEAFGKCAVQGSPVESRCKMGIDDANLKAKQVGAANSAPR